jgi:hypothetical protein
MKIQLPLAIRVTTQLKRHHHSAFNLVTPIVAGEKVTLSGQVASFHHRQVCIELTKRLKGVADVVDQLHVEPDAFLAADPQPPSRSSRRTVASQTSEVTTLAEIT